MPPSEASAPGSIGKNRPWSRRYSLSCLRVTPGSITQSRSSACTVSTLFMSRKSTQTPPSGALIWPSSEVPVPNAITGTLCLAQMRTVCCTSAVDCGNTTASGGWFSIQVSVLPCCSRTACEVTTRLPNAAVSSPIAAWMAAGLRAGAAGLLVCATAIRHPRKKRWAFQVWRLDGARHGDDPAGLRGYCHACSIVPTLNRSFSLPSSLR